MGDQTGGIDADMKLASFAAGNSDGGDTGQTSQTRPNNVIGNIPQTCLVTFVGNKAVTYDRKNREGQPLDIANSRSRRQR